jgi:hypothetical protein
MGQNYYDAKLRGISRYDAVKVPTACFMAFTKLLCQLGYASQLFYILVVAVAKQIGVLFALRLRSTSRFYQLALQTLMYTVVVWSLYDLTMLRKRSSSDIIRVFFIGTAFQCQAPKTWQYVDGNCHDQVRPNYTYPPSLFRMLTTDTAVLIPGRYGINQHFDGPDTHDNTISYGMAVAHTRVEEAGHSVCFRNSYSVRQEVDLQHCER